MKFYYYHFEWMNVNNKKLKKKTKSVYYKELKYSATTTNKREMENAHVNEWMDDENFGFR